MRTKIENTVGLLVGAFLAISIASGKPPAEHEIGKRNEYLHREDFVNLVADLVIELPEDELSIVEESDVPRIVIKERFEEGEPVVAAIDPPDGDIKIRAVEWELRLEHLPAPGPDRGVHIWPKGQGIYPIRLNWAVQKGEDIIIGHEDKQFRVGPLEPEKPLNELVTKDVAAKLSEMYTKMLAGTNILEGKTVSMFWLTHDQFLSLNGLTGHAASSAIEKRLSVAVGERDCPDQLNIGDLALELNNIIKELGASPVPPGPEPPDPTPTPDDPWGVGETVKSVVSALSAAVKSQASATGDLFLKAAAGLEDGSFASIGIASSWLKEERKKLWGTTANEWSAVESAVNEIWQSNWPLSRAEVIQFYRCVASGLKGVQ